MGRALMAAGIIASAFLLLSCQKKPSTELPPPAIADAKSGFSIINDLPFGEISSGAFTQKSTVQIGEKLALLGQTERATQGGKDRELIQVRRDTGAVGWVRSDMVVSKCILAVITTDDAVIYSVPRNTAATTSLIPRQTVLVIHADSAGMPFIRVSGYDPGSQTFFRGVYLRNEGVSARPDDVQAAILLQLAAASKNGKQQEAFLTSALKDYPQSLFLPQLQAALDALHGIAPAPQPATAAPPAPAAALQAPPQPAVSTPAPTTAQPAPQSAPVAPAAAPSSPAPGAAPAPAAPAGAPAAGQ